MKCVTLVIHQTQLMKNIYLLLILGLIVSSCKKDQEVPSTESISVSKKKYAVSFNASGFTSVVVNMVKKNGVSSVPAGDKTSDLTYLVYNSDGVEIKRIEHNRRNESQSAIVYRVNSLLQPLYIGDEGVITEEGVYGSITDSLATGTYTIVMVATELNAVINNYDDSNFNYEKLQNSYFLFYDGEGSANPSIYRTRDTYFKKFTLTVNGDVSDNVELPRIVGQIEINLQDSKPGDTYVTNYIGEQSGYTFSTEAPTGGLPTPGDEFVKDNVITPGTLNLKYSNYIINTDKPIQVEIKAYRAGELVATKIIKDVRVYKNKRTILTGKMYDSTPAVGFNVSVNDEFDSEPVNVEF